MKNDLVVCVIDDDVSAREAIAALVRSAGLGVEAYASAHDYLTMRRAATPACLVVDIQLPGLTGLELQERLLKDEVEVPIVFVSGHSDVRMSVRALKAGACDFFTKPFDPDQLLKAIHDGIATVRAATQEEALALVSGGFANAPADDSRSSCAQFMGIVGRSGALDAVLEDVRTVAETDSTVLIYGETGTGKELVARAIHDLSDRRGGPFVKLNCGAIPAGLLESELMGHEKGAFTGAIAQRIGRFELAHDGTLFLDEIGEMALELQPKLLRLLQEREFERVGGTRTVRSNARVVAATNRDLGAMVRDRTFREDLYYRLSVFPLALPPLRERREDIPALVEHFVRRVAARLKKEAPAIAAPTMLRLKQYDWPGNVRELENVVERAMILARGPTLEFPLPSNAGIVHAKAPGIDDLAAINRAHILGVLEATGWIVAGPHGAAARLGVKRSTLNYRMKKLGIPPARSRGRALDV
jgi:DNA-binding NtrC family response regulator